MGISSLLVMITLGLDMHIGNPMPWIHSLNLRRDRITYWVDIASHFDQIKVICPVSLILFIGARDYFPVISQLQIVGYIRRQSHIAQDTLDPKGLRHIIPMICLVHQCLIVVGDLYPTNYDEVVSNVCAHLRQGAIKRQLESLYSNIVWVPVKAPKGIKLIGVS